MAALAAGDRSAFDVVFRALWPRCRAFAQKLLDDDALADDAAQQALLQLFHEAPRFEKSGIDVRKCGKEHASDKKDHDYCSILKIDFGVAKGDVRKQNQENSYSAGSKDC